MRRRLLYDSLWLCLLGGRERHYGDALYCSCDMAAENTILPGGLRIFIWKKTSRRGRLLWYLVIWYAIVARHTPAASNG